VSWGVLIPKDAPVECPNERGIELPLAREVLQFTQPGRILDAGCALNGFVGDDCQAQVFHLTQNITSETAYEHKTHPLSYISGDLRDLGYFAGGAFDRTACVSTLEHVGLDNRTYQGPVENEPRTAMKALQELCRVTRHAIIVTVPFADPPYECTQWRYFNKRGIGQMAWMLQNFGLTVDVRFYAKCAGGWYGGDTSPVEASAEGFPESVNAVACLRGLA